MRRITLWLLATVTVVVLLFSYRTSTGAGGPTALTAPEGAGPPGPVAAPGPVDPPARGGVGPAPGSGVAPTASPVSSPAPRPERVNGTVADTQWGPVQVQVTLIGHRITDVRALVYPSGNGHDQAVNSYALPRLRSQALAAQSAHIDGVSGATVTSDGYRRSLQAALDAARSGH